MRKTLTVCAQCMQYAILLMLRIHVDTHHRVQVAKLVHLYVCTLVIAILPSPYEWWKITTSASCIWAVSAFLNVLVQVKFLW